MDLRHSLEEPLLERLGATPPIPLEDKVVPENLNSVFITADEGASGSGRPSFSFRRLLAFMGPGILMSIAYVVSTDQLHC